MKIGFDLDNTIVCYDESVKELSRQVLNLENYDDIHKSNIKKYFFDRGEESKWTEFQGLLYGPGMKHANAYGGLVNTFNVGNNNGFELFIISHRTKFPFLGERYDLHGHALTWIKNHINLKKEIIPLKNIYFLETKEEKIRKIKSLECDIFIDDLPEILTGIGFDNNCRKILFDPNSENKTWHGEKLDSWYNFKY